MLKATILLSAGGLVCKALGAVYRIPLSNILGAEGMGLYQLLFPLYSFALVFVTGGLSLSISKYTSQAIANGQTKKISSYFWSGIFFSGAIGLFFGLFFALFAKQIAFFQGDGSAYFGYYPIAIAVFFASMLSCFRGMFQGYSNMTPTFISNMVEQVFKLVIGLLLAYYLSFYSTSLAVTGAFFAIAISEIIAFFYLLITTLFQNKKKKILIYKLQFSSFNDGKKMLGYCFGLTITALLIPLSNALQSLLCAKLLILFGHSKTFARILFGIQNGMVQAIISFPSVIIVALATTIVPSLSALLAKKQSQKTLQIVGEVYHVVWILILPCVVGIFVFASPIMSSAFAFALDESTRLLAANILQMSSFLVLFMSIVQLSTVLLQVVGYGRRAFWSLTILFVLNICLMVTLVPIYSIFGLVLANTISYGIASVFELVFMSNYKPKLKKEKIVLPIFFSILMGIICKYLYNILPFNVQFLKLIICVIFAIIFYFSLLIIFKIISIRYYFSKK